MGSKTWASGLRRGADAPEVYLDHVRQRWADWGERILCVLVRPVLSTSHKRAPAAAAECVRWRWCWRRAATCCAGWTTSVWARAAWFCSGRGCVGTRRRCWRFGDGGGEGRQGRTEQRATALRVELRAVVGAAVCRAARSPPAAAQRVLPTGRDQGAERERGRGRSVVVLGHDYREVEIRVRSSMRRSGRRRRRRSGWRGGLRRGGRTREAALGGRPGPTGSVPEMEAAKLKALIDAFSAAVAAAMVG